MATLLGIATAPDTTARRQVLRCGTCESVVAIRSKNGGYRLVGPSCGHDVTIVGENIKVLPAYATLAGPRPTTICGAAYLEATRYCERLWDNLVQGAWQAHLRLTRTAFPRRNVVFTDTEWSWDGNGKYPIPLEPVLMKNIIEPGEAFADVRLQRTRELYSAMGTAAGSLAGLQPEAACMFGMRLASEVVSVGPAWDGHDALEAGAPALGGMMDRVYQLARDATHHAAG